MIEEKVIKSVPQYLLRLLYKKGLIVDLLVCMAWASLLSNIVRGVVNRIPGLSAHIDEMVAVFYLIPTLLALPVLLKKFTLFDYFFYLAWPLLYLFNYLAYPENETILIDTAFNSLCVAAPCYFIGRLLDIDRYYKVFIFLSAVCILWDVFYFVSFVQSMKSAKEMANVLSDDNMGFAYAVLPHVMFMFWVTMRKFNFFTLILGIIGIFLVLSFGSRGPLACLGFFIFVFFFFFMKNKYSKYIKIALISLFALIIPFTVEFTLLIKYTFEELNFSTRIVDRILTGGMTHDTGRSGIRDTLYNLLDKSDNIFGFGIYGSERFGILYAHNFFCDIFFSFGYYLGTIFIIMFVSLLVYAFVMANKKEKECMLFLFSLSFIKLMVSNTYIADPLFFMLIGYCVNNNRNKEFIFNES